MEFDVSSLSRADQLHLSAASGWIGLGDLASAREEMQKFSDKARTHPQAMAVQSEYYFASKEWDRLVPLADQMVKLFPDHAELWIHRSYALHELRRTREAFDALLPGTEKFPKVWLIRYNLACYCAQLKQVDEALRWLHKAISLADKKDVMAMALEDPDLAPVRDAIREM